jgi:hypothetical protein
MDGNPVFRGIAFIFVKQRGCIVGVQNAAESLGVFGEVMFRSGVKFPEGLLANVFF